MANSALAAKLHHRVARLRLPQHRQNLFLTVNRTFLPVPAVLLCSFQRTVRTQTLSFKPDWHSALGRSWAEYNSLMRAVSLYTDSSVWLGSQGIVRRYHASNFRSQLHTGTIRGHRDCDVGIEYLVFMGLRKFPHSPE